MIIKAKHNFLIYNFLKIYLLWKIRRNFHSVTISGNIEDKGMPVLVVSNHVSWWDGFWVMYFNMKVFHRKFHFMMLAEQLQKFWFFRFAGGFSVKKGSRSVTETIEHARELLVNNKNLVLLFPQGEIASIYNSTFRFSNGIERIIKGFEGRIQIIMNANLIDFHSEQKPSLYCFLSEFTKPDYSCASIEVEYNRFYKSCVDSIITKTFKG
jgi:hypothetical protein